MKNNACWLLYLDDERNPKQVGWTIARTVSHAKILIQLLGLPICMSLDHDLGPNENAHDFVKWLVYEKNYDLRGIDINIHSANPLAKDKMMGLIENWNKELNEKGCDMIDYETNLYMKHDYHLDDFESQFEV